MRSAIFAGLSYPGFHAIAEDVPLEFGEDREHAGQGPTARRGQVERLAERDEADLECGQLLERRDQIDEGCPQRSNRQTRIRSSSRRRAARIRSSRLGRSRTPEPTSSTMMATVHPRRLACSRMAESCKGSVCWSWVETRA